MHIDVSSMVILPLFNGLSAQEIEQFISVTGAFIKYYDKDTFITKTYTDNANIGVLVDGRAQVIIEDWMGNEKISYGFRHGALIGEVPAILATSYGSTNFVKALANSSVLWIPYRNLLSSAGRLGALHGIVMKNLLECMATRNSRLMDKIELISHHSLRERVIIYLLQREKRQHTQMVKITGRSRMARELECNRSALTREISRMEQAGLIVVDVGRMMLVKEKLFAGDENDQDNP